MIFVFCFNIGSTNLLCFPVLSLSLSLSCSLAAVLPSLEIICIKRVFYKYASKLYTIFLLLALMLESTPGLGFRALGFMKDFKDTFKIISLKYYADKRA